VLIGLPMPWIGRAANMAMFCFGKEVTAVDCRGREMQKSEHSLHVQCHWRIVGQYPTPRIIVGSRDVYDPAAPSVACDDDFEWDRPEANLCDRRTQSFLEEHQSSPLMVESVEADEVGSLRVCLMGGFVLELFPDTSCHDDGDEHWRLLAADDRPHFVVTGRGIEAV
jgi:hypothetical protein